MNEMVIGLLTISIPYKVCGGFLFGKQPRTAFKSHMHIKENDVLHIVYSDVCGPFEVSSLAKNQYCHICK